MKHKLCIPLLIFCLSCLVLVAQEQNPIEPTGTIVFTSSGFTEAGATQQGIYRMNADGTEITRLTDGRGDALARISPNGEQVAFHSQKNIFLMTIDGQDLHRLDVPGTASLPVWSPDSQHLLFAINNSSIGMSNADGSDYQRIAFLEGAFGLMFPYDWHPDGLHVLVGISERNGKNLYTINLETKEATQLTDTEDNESAARYSPDGNHIVYHAGEWNELDLFILNVESGDVSNITNSADLVESHPVWSSDGNYIAYSVREKTGDRSRFIGIITPDGEYVALLSEGKYGAGHPSWFVPEADDAGDE